MLQVALRPPSAGINPAPHPPSHRPPLLAALPLQRPHRGSLVRLGLAGRRRGPAAFCGAGFTPAGGVTVRLQVALRPPLAGINPAPHPPSHRPPLLAALP